MTEGCSLVKRTSPELNVLEVAGLLLPSYPPLNQLLVWQIFGHDKIKALVFMIFPLF